MLIELQFLFNFVVENLVQIWPYLLVTIPLAVAVQLSGAAKFIRRALTARPLLAIVLATAVGAFSPFCSCTVIPVVAALLIGGVPLAPVMSFWIASPSMDPETFFLSVATIGWKLAVWRPRYCSVWQPVILPILQLIETGWVIRSCVKNQRPLQLQPVP